MGILQTFRDDYPLISHLIDVLICFVNIWVSPN